MIRLRDSRNESGQVVILVAFIMVFLLSIVALVIDLGGLYDRRRDLQTAADAAALAAAREMIVSQNAALSVDKAREYEGKNVSPNSNVDGAHVSWLPDPTSGVTTPDVNLTEGYVSAYLRESAIPFAFARIFGRTDGAVAAYAKAGIKYLTGVDKLFPAAINYMNPIAFRFRFVLNGVQKFEFQLEDLAPKDGVFDSGGTGYTPPLPELYSNRGGAQLYDVYLDTWDGSAYTEVGKVGYWRVANMADPEEKLYRVGISRDVDADTLTVQALCNPLLVTDATLSGSLGPSSFTMTRVGTTSEGVLYRADGVPAPTRTGNAGFSLNDLTINHVTQGSIPAAGYVSFNPDVPFKYQMMLESFYNGYSAIGGQSTPVGAKIVVRTLEIGDTYTMKLGNQAGSGLYSGNWRTADIWREPSTREEIGTVNQPDSWTLNIDPLEIGGHLMPQTGAQTGQIIQGLDDRFSPEGIANVAMDDPRRVVIIPIVDYSQDLSGSSNLYTISEFAAFRITSYSQSGDIQGEFVHWATAGSWTDDKPDGGLYLETAVLTD